MTLHGCAPGGCSEKYPPEHFQRQAERFLPLRRLPLWPQPERGEHVLTALTRTKARMAPFGIQVGER